MNVTTATARDPGTTMKPKPPTPDEAFRRQYEALRNAAEELLTCASLRGDNALPHPADDPKLWTARMQDAWDTLAVALEASPPTVPPPPTPATPAAIYGFYEDEWPQYADTWTNELQELVTAEVLNAFVGSVRARLEELQNPQEARHAKNA